MSLKEKFMLLCSNPAEKVHSLTDVPDEDKPIIRDQIMRDNRKFVIIFSTVGLLIGHFVDKSRFERYIYARSVEKLADIQTRYAYYDQMTGLNQAGTTLI